MKEWIIRFYYNNKQVAEYFICCDDSTAIMYANSVAVNHPNCEWFISFS